MRLPPEMLSQAMMPTPPSAMMAAAQDARDGRSPVIHGLSSPVKMGESAPITETVAVPASVSEVT